MRIAPLLDSPSELTDLSGGKCAVVLMTRLRLARNLTGHPFPGWAKEAQRSAILAACTNAIAALPQMKKGFAVAISEISDLEKQILVERHLISRELTAGKAGAGLVISKDQSQIVMINEEDHLRIQVLRAGYQLKKVWSTINQLDSDLEEQLDFAFSPEIGYLTACPTNLGTALRASAMMHLPALVIASQMEKVVRAVNQLGMAVRGWLGEGSDASGSIFQISNQTTLGESEEEIIKRLTSVLNTIIGHELNAREKLLEADASKLHDKIGRAYGILQNGYVLSSSEAMNLLSLIRLGIDLRIFPETYRPAIDRLFIESQPAHVQYAAKGSLEIPRRDVLRAQHLREEFAKFAQPEFKLIGNN
jgi:protein arginine kinase